MTKHDDDKEPAPHDEQATAPPNASDRDPRQPGALQGKIWMAPDFDVLPDDILAAMED
jgi:hypothetical protein